jgi:hypothetical protein
MMRKFDGVGTVDVAWLTTMDRPAIVSVAERTGPAFAATV